MGLSAYLILVGIYSSAISVSEDSILRQSIRTIAIKESSLLDSIGMAQMEQQIQRKVFPSIRASLLELVDNIGTAQMEQEIERRVLKVAKEQQDVLTEQSGIESSLTEDDMKEYLEQVIKEVKKEGPSS